MLRTLIVLFFALRQRQKQVVSDSAPRNVIAHLAFN
jgi:hypothetical protein